MFYKVPHMHTVLVVIMQIRIYLQHFMLVLTNIYTVRKFFYLFYLSFSSSRAGLFLSMLPYDDVHLVEVLARRYH